MILRCSMLCLSLLFSVIAASQYHVKEKLLIENVNKAHDDSAKVMAMSNLAEFYYVYRAQTKADSVLNAELTLAEFSTNKNLLLLALFDNSVLNTTFWTSTKNFDKTLEFLNKGLVYARQTGKEFYEATAYLRKAMIYRRQGNFDNALNEVVLASSVASELNDDSLKTIIAIETGDISLAKGKPVDAYKHYNRAYDLAYSIKNIPLQSSIFHHYAALYMSLKEKGLAKDNLLKSLRLNQEHNYNEGILEDYVDLARYLDVKEYFLKVIELSKSSDEKNKLRAKRLMFSYLMTVEKNCDLTLNYYKQNPDLQQSYENSGSGQYYWSIGNIYKYCNRNDSALFYYNKALPDMEGRYGNAIMKDVYGSIAECYHASGDFNQAIVFFEKAVESARSIGDLEKVTEYALTLSNLSAARGDFKKAYAYQKDHLLLKDSLQDLSEKREVVLLEVDRENKKHEKDIQEAALKASRIRNLQYMGITAAIATFFIFMMLMGMFPISKVTIKMLSFFAFICLFEFIVLLIDSYLHKLTHGEPLKIWLIKIFLIAVLVPIQHFLEHGMVHFLASQRLLRMRQHLSIKRLFLTLKKPAPKEEVGIEEDTAVL